MVTYALAAAGTGGHVFPALAVADALLARGVAREDVVFFGGDRMEATTVPGAGFSFFGVEIRGLRRSLSRQNLGLPGVVRRAQRQIEDEMERRGTAVLAGFGGYVTVPAALAANRRAIPVFLQEQNAEPGLANRLMARRARESFVAFPAATHRLRRSRLVGNPLRSGFDGFDRNLLRAAARARYDLPQDVPVVGVLGGSLGARILNETVPALVEALPIGAAVLHLTGRSHYEEMRGRATASPVTWRPVAFEDSMEDFYAASDIVLSRAGALTISELAVTATPAVVVPYAAGTAGHQAANASEMAAAGGLIVVNEGDVGSVPALLAELVADPPRRLAMGAAAAGCARPGAAGIIADALVEAVRG